MGWGDVRYCFAMAILVIFVCSISRRFLDQTLWNLIGISYAIWSCAIKGWFFQNGCRCHGNDKNANKLKNTKKSTLFCFHGNCGKVCPTNSDFFGLSPSSRCGCFSYQVSSISVWRVICYDHFCVFQFVCIFVVSMATAAILKKSTLNSTTLDSFHQTSWNFVGIFTIACGSFWRVLKIQNGITMETEVPK
jgi:hypothetical protein